MEELKKIKIHNISLLFILIYFVFGVIFYDYVDKRFSFSYIDEIFVVILGLIYFCPILINRQNIESWVFKLACVFIAYLVYSTAIVESNHFSAVFADFLIVVKPFLACFICYSISKRTSDLEKYAWLFKYLSLIGLGFVLGLVLVGGNHGVTVFFGHPSRFSTAAVCGALLFLYSRKSEKYTSIVAVYLALLAISVLSGRSKAFGFFGFSFVFAVFALLEEKNIGGYLKPRNLLMGIFALAAAVFFAYEKIEFYFVRGLDFNNMFARPAMYIASLWIAWDYFPFGSGFASFGSYYSGQYYSHIYADYNLDIVHGLTEKSPIFISDALFPMVLGQFGFFGLALLMFLAYISLKLSHDFYRASKEKVLFFLAVSIIIFLMIESVADLTLTQNRGVFVMCILGLLMGEMKQKLCRYRKGVKLKLEAERFLSS